MKPRPYIPPEKFRRRELPNVTVISPAKYMALLKAASDKGKMPQFYKWQQDRKIILKG